MLALASWVVVVSEEDRRRVERLGLARRKVVLIPHGVDTENYRGGDRVAMRRRLGVAPDELFIVYHGVLHYPPNLEAVRVIIYELLPRLRSLGVGVKVLLIGVSPPPEADMTPEVIVTGAIEHLPPYLMAADVGVVPLTAGGGTRLKVLEYMAAGLPVVSTTLGVEGYPFAADGELIIADDWDTFAARLAELASDAGRRDRIGRHNRKLAERYDWLRIAERYERLYYELLG